jgi:dienelactone hydrolase
MITARDIEYTVDGRTMRGRLAIPDGDGRRPAVLIAHEGNGLDELQRTRPERLAELGYVAFALDYHGEGRVFTEPDQMMTRVGELGSDLDQVRKLGQAGLDVLTSEPRTDPTRLAAIGYCFGGTLVLELARAGAELKAVVGFHPGLAWSRPEDSGNVRGAVLVCIGSEDPMVPAEHRAMFEQDMRAAGVDWRMNIYGGAEHSFTHPRVSNLEHEILPGLNYHRPSDERSWRAMLDLFDETLGEPASV